MLSLHYRIVDTRRVHIAPVGTHFAFVFVSASRTSIQFSRIPFFASARERPDGITTDTVPAHVLLVAFVNIFAKT